MLNILVIDDDRIIRDAITVILRDETFGVICAVDGADGERALKKIPLILSSLIYLCLIKMAYRQFLIFDAIGLL